MVFSQSCVVSCKMMLSSHYFISLSFVRWWCIGQCTWAVDYQCSWNAQGRGSKLFCSQVNLFTEWVTMHVCIRSSYMYSCPVLCISVRCTPLLIDAWVTSRLAGLVNSRLMVAFSDVTWDFLLHSFPTRVTGGLQWRWSAYPVKLDTFGLLCLSHIDLTISSSGNMVGGGYPTK